MAKRLTPVLAVVLFFILTFGVIWGIDDPEKNSRMLKCNEPTDYLISNTSSIFLDGFYGENSILSPYDTVIGYTWYDYQHNSRIPRMNANDNQSISAGGHGHHYAFMYQNSWGTGSHRYVSVTYYDADYQRDDYQL